MIRDMGNRIVHADDKRLRYRVSVTDYPKPRAKRPRAPRTAIVCCETCGRAYPRRTHDPYVCAERRRRYNR